MMFLGSMPHILGKTLGRNLHDLLQIARTSATNFSRCQFGQWWEFGHLVCRGEGLCADLNIEWLYRSVSYRTYEDPAFETNLSVAEISRTGNVCPVAKAIRWCQQWSHGLRGDSEAAAVISSEVYSSIQGGK